jgi:hypothetical protein
MADETKPTSAPHAPARQGASKGRPTPTQEELNQLASGQHPELSNDGSGPDPTEKHNTVRHIGVKYEHRQMSSR